MTTQPPVNVNWTKIIFLATQNKKINMHTITGNAMQPVDPLEVCQCFSNPPCCLEYLSIHEPLPMEHDVINEFNK